eukprot:TRINITY_DN14545_c0_g3_i1.p1 TRINITY_DN14545_c0_g3~~TRINITY_DN14545_c0_g3_i1.p1  ORF type:complete len:649 (+),score=170.56 TRINITY_DN14545_c0_g3_i1:113-2059(+)
MAVPGAIRPRYGVGIPEVVPTDIEDGSKQRMVSMAGAGGRPLIQPFQGVNTSGRLHGSRRTHSDGEGTQKVAVVFVVIWLAGWLLLGYEFLWPLYWVLNIVSGFLSVPPFSWIFGWVYRGAPLVTPISLIDELQLPTQQVAQYLDAYVTQYGDAALIYASHDGYPQIVKGLLYSQELGYRDLVDARDDTGNTALIYAASRGFKQCTAALLRNGADPDIGNTGGGGRTALMEASGQGFRDIVTAIRTTPNVTIDLQDDNGNTALHYAAYYGNLAVVLDLLKSSPSKDIKNSYGLSALDYATSRSFKAVADALSRGVTRSQRLAREAEQKDLEKAKATREEFEKHLQDTLKKNAAKEKHVKGNAEQTHKDARDFGAKPASQEHAVPGSGSDAERQALEEQLSDARKKHEEAELQAQRRIMELLEKSSGLQRALDAAESAKRGAQLNMTELSFRLKETESKLRASELRVQEESDRAKRLEEAQRSARSEIERYKDRAELAERERAQHAEVSRRHEEGFSRAQEELSQHVGRLEQQQRELSELRMQKEKAERELTQTQDRLRQLQREHGVPATAATSAASASASGVGNLRDAAVPANSGTVAAGDGLAGSDSGNSAGSRGVVGRGDASGAAASLVSEREEAAAVAAATSDGL